MSQVPLPQPATAFRVALLGFSSFEREALATYFRACARRVPLYRLVPTLDDGDFVLADADHGPSVQLVLATERMADALFIGGRAPPPGSAAWMTRPIDPLHVIRELDALVAASGREATAPALPVVTPPPLPAPQSRDLPRALFQPPPPAAPARTRQATAAPLPPQPPTALVVDDSEIARHFLRGRLERWGLRVESAASSGQAINLLFRQRFDYLFLDVELGSRSQLDGLGLCQLIRRKHPPAGGAPTLVVMVSAFHAEVDRVRGTLAGCDAYLAKPVDDEALGKLLRREGLKLIDPLPVQAVQHGQAQTAG
jgi:CheY-like chemotaxis protein